MVGVEPVLLDPADPRAVDPVQGRLGRGVRIGIVADIGGRRPVDRDVPPAAGGGDRHRIDRAVQAGAEHLLLDRQFLAVAHGGGEIDLARLFVDSVQMFDRIVAARDRPDTAAVAVVQVQVPPAAVLVRPDETAVRQDVEVVVQIDPGLGLLAEDDARGTGGRIDTQQVERLLVARLTLDIQGLAVLGPIDPRQIDVGVRAQVHLDPRAALKIADIEFDLGIGTAGAGIALLDHGRAAAGDLEPGHDVHRAFVHAGQGDVAFVGAPPVAGVAVHLLLGDELGRGPGDQTGAVVGDRRLLARGQIIDDQVLVADPGNEIALGRDLGVDLVGLGLGQAAHLAVGAAGQEDVALQRRKDVAALLVPGVFDHPARADPHPLAPRLFGLGQFAGVGNQGAGVDQLVGLALAGGRGPQVLDVHIVFARAQEGDQLAVGRQADPLGHRAVQAGAGEDPFRRQDVGGGLLGDR